VAKVVAKEEQKRVSPWVVAFVIFHVVVTTISALPKPNKQVLEGTAEARGSDVVLKFNHQVVKEKPIVYGYLFPTGLWQYWDMFSPDPAQIDYWGDAEVYFLDGTMTVFPYPRVYTAPLWEKYLIERYRKFYERAHDENHTYIWPYFAQRIAMINASDENNPPIRVYLRRHFQDLRNTHETPQKKLPDYKMYRYFNYVVDQETLFQVKGWKAKPQWMRSKDGQRGTP
jgi:hypothetical protein